MIRAAITITAISAPSAMGTRDLAMANGRLTDEVRREIVSLYQSGISILELARRYEVSSGCIRQALEKAGQKRRRPGGVSTLTPEQIASIPALYEIHGSLKKTAEALGVHFRTIHKHMVQRNSQRRGRGAVPLSDERRKEIRRLYAELGSYSEVQRRTGHSYNAIVRIVKEESESGEKP